ncbi:MAG: PHP domain-containing protein [Patescibacteria group bacterium]
MLIDLQLHSIYSDGYLKPEELARFVANNKVKVAAITDHNTTAGIEPFRAACKKYKIKVINGMEIYCKYKGRKVNILWYNFNKDDECLLKLLKESRCRRATSAKKALIKLKRRGFRIDVDNILSKFDNYIPVNRLSDEITKDRFNYQKIFREVKKKNKFAKILREEDVLSILFFGDKKNHLNEVYINIERVLKARESAGGQLIFCHPGKSNRYAHNMVYKLRDIGIDGVETLSPHHSIGAIMYLQFLSETLDMIATGGSDFHKFEESEGYKIKSFADWFKVDSKNLRRIEEIIN